MVSATVTNNSITGNKRVLYLVDKSGFGGVQTIAYTLMSHVVDERIEIDFFFLRNLNDRFNMEYIREPNVFYSRAQHRYSLRPFFELLRLIRERNVSVLHLNGNKSIILGLFIKKFFYTDIKIIAHEHGGVFDYTRWYPAFLKLFRRHFDLFITISNYRKNFLMSRCAVDGSKIRVLYNFVDPARVRGTGVSAAVNSGGRRADGKVFIIGYLGGLSRIKGCDVLIRAISILKQRLTAFRVVIAGDGPARAELEKLAAGLRLNDVISFVGFVEQPAAAYATFDIMVIPSRSEAGPMCLYEAWTMGLPVVASNAPVLDEIIEDRITGILFESENPQDLADKILLAHNDKGLVERIKIGSSREAAGHSVDQYLARLREIYMFL